MAPKQLQMKLNFSPRALLPPLRAHGAAVTTSSCPGDVANLPTPQPGDFAILPNRKVRRELNAGQKLDILAFRKPHSREETLKKFSEISESTLKRLMKKENFLKKAVARGHGYQKRLCPLKKYRDMWVAMDVFFRQVREAHGAVSRNLLEAFAMSLPDVVKQDYFTVTR